MTTETITESIDVSLLIPVTLAADNEEIKAVYPTKTGFAYAMRMRKHTGLDKAVIRVNNLRFLYLPAFRKFLATCVEAK